MPRSAYETIIIRSPKPAADGEYDYTKRETVAGFQGRVGVPYEETSTFDPATGLRFLIRTFERAGRRESEVHGRLPKKP